MANYKKKVCKRVSARCRLCKAHKVVGNSERVTGNRRPNKRKTSKRTLSWNDAMGIVLLKRYQVWQELSDL